MRGSKIVLDLSYVKLLVLILLIRKNLTIKIFFLKTKAYCFICSKRLILTRVVKTSRCTGRTALACGPILRVNSHTLWPRSVRLFASNWFFPYRWWLRADIRYKVSNFDQAQTFFQLIFDFFLFSVQYLGEHIFRRT